MQSQLMEALAKLEEDKQPDDGEVEIPSAEEFVGQFSAFLLDT